MTDIQYLDNRKKMLEQAILDKSITQDDAELISTFISSKATKTGAKRAYKYTYTLIGIRKKGFLTVPYRELKKTDFDLAIERMNHHGYKQNTLRDCIDFFKRFVLWMIDQELGAIKPGDRAEREIQRLSPGRRDRMTKTQNDIYSSKEMDDLIRASPGPMWKAFIALIFDGAFRPEEAGHVTWGQLRLEKTKASVNTSKKTGRPRLVPCYRALPYLKQWANEYPGKRTKDAYVFLNEWQLPMKYQTIRRKIKMIAVSAGIDPDRMKAHNFRHTGITDMQRRKVNDTIIQMICWGGPSTMLSTYSHLMNSDTDDAIAESLGIKSPNETVPRALESHLCPKCAAIAPATYTYCPDCGWPLTEDAQDKLQSMKDEIDQDPEFQRAMARAMEVMKQEFAKEKMGY